MTEFTKYFIDGRRLYLSAYKLFPLGDPVVITDLVKGCIEALDEIERLQQRIAELEDELHSVASDSLWESRGYDRRP